MTNKALRILYIFNGIFVLASALLGPLYAVWVGTIENSVLAISISYAFFWGATTIFMFIVGRIGDRFKEKEYLLLAGFLIRSLVWFSFIFVNSLPTLIIALIFLALGESLGTPAFGAIFAEHLGPGRHIADYSYWSMINNLMIAAGSAVGGVIVAYFGFSILFAIMSVMALIPFFGVLFQPRKLL